MMWRRIAKVVGGLLLALGVIGFVFVVGMRTKSPLVLDAIRRSGRATKPFVLKSSGTPGGIASIVRHSGRTTGRPYETPVQAVVTDDGFVIALPYGPNTDWLQNVLVAGAATIVHEGTSYLVDRPELVPTSAVATLFSPTDRRTHRLFRVDQCLLVRRAEPDDAAEQITDPTRAAPTE
jgi:deazaflavin-dependent oxidoreductase (nitroreductase family)